MLQDQIISGWINVFKPVGISSARVVSQVKKYLPKKTKIGHAGTLDLEAEGVLPLALGEATKLISVLMDAKKEYVFKIQFGSSTDTLDKAGKVLNRCAYIPSKEEAVNVVSKFIGPQEQMPPIFSALKINGKRAYNMARNNEIVELALRRIVIYELEMLSYDAIACTATYRTVCSKGTYVRSLARDISLSLQSLGFVLELRRSIVGVFHENDSIDIEHCKDMLQNKCLKPELVLADIPALDIVDCQIADKIKKGQVCFFSDILDASFVWLRYNNNILAIGGIKDGKFLTSRVFNF